MGRVKKDENSKTLTFHTKFSSDNIMRKIKNKVIESSRLLINKILYEESKIMNIKLKTEIYKIKGAFSQELNIKFNFWFYQMKLKDIFCLDISSKYRKQTINSNEDLINYLYSPVNENKFIKTKQLLETSFHKYYHDIFLNEDPNWKIQYGINGNDIKYQIDNLFQNIENEGIDEEKYINNIKVIALNYEKFYLLKKPRTNNKDKKNNHYIKSIIIKHLNEKYLEFESKFKELEEYYSQRKDLNKILKSDIIPLKEESNI